MAMWGEPLHQPQVTRDLRIDPPLIDKDQGLSGQACYP